jgi:hypothetical protein
MYRQSELLLQGPLRELLCACQQLHPCATLTSLRLPRYSSMKRCFWLAIRACPEPTAGSPHVQYLMNDCV